MAKITISEIAKHAGVSKTAVSFAFNAPSKLPDETVQRILKVANDMGYLPSPVARSLAGKRTGNLGLLFPQPMSEVMQNPYTLELLRGVGAVCDEQGYNIMLVSPILGSMRQAVSGAAVDGFLTIGLEYYKSTVRLLDQRDIPYVMVDSDPTPGAACVNIDDVHGAYSVMKHVLDHGHRRIDIYGIESGKHGDFETYVGTLQHRIHGYRIALQEVGLDIDGQAVRLIECACTREGGSETFVQSWDSDSRPTAIVAMADIIALGTLETAQRHGVRIPTELSIVGYDDLPVSRWCSPALTTVRQPIVEKGRFATELLLERLNGESAGLQHVLPTTMIDRASVAQASSPH